MNHLHFDEPNKRFIDEIAEGLLTSHVDPRHLASKFTTRMGIEPHAANQALYSIVKAVNEKLFGPLAKAELILVEGCNLACRYCFEGNLLNTHRNARRLMSDSTIKKAIDLVFDYSREHSTIDITLFGGEPTLNMRGIQTAVQHANLTADNLGKKVVFNMTSNGVLFTPKMVDYFADNSVKVLLSIDGLARAHDMFRVDHKGEGTFDRVIESLSLLKSRQPWVGVKMTIMPAIADTLFESVVSLNSMGVNQFLIGHATGVDWTDSQLQEYKNQKQQLRAWYIKNKGDTLKIVEFDKPKLSQGFFGCSAGRNTIAVSCNGDITGCSRISTLHDTVDVGRLGHVDFGLFEIKTRAEMSGCSKLRTNCGEAGITDQYAGGCFATNYEETGDLFKPNKLQHKFSILLRDITSATTSK